MTIGMRERWLKAEAEITELRAENERLRAAWRTVRAHPFFQHLPDGCGSELCDAIAALDREATDAT